MPLLSSNNTYDPNKDIPDLTGKVNSLVDSSADLRSLLKYHVFSPHALSSCPVFREFLSLNVYSPSTT